MVKEDLERKIRAIKAKKYKSELNEVSKALSTKNFRFNEWTEKEEQFLMQEDGFTVYQKAVHLSRPYGEVLSRKTTMQNRRRGLVSLQTKLPRYLHEQIKSSAREQGMSVNDWIVAALEEMLRQDQEARAVARASKECVSCKEKILLRHFHLDASRRDGRKSKCMDCVSKYNKFRYAQARTTTHNS